MLTGNVSECAFGYSARRIGLCVLALLGMVSAVGTAFADVAACEPAERQDEKRDVRSLLESLTFEDFRLREEVVRWLSAQGLDGARQLLRLAEDGEPEIRRKARYMLRRTFWELTTHLSKECGGPSGQRRADARVTLIGLAKLYPLDSHHHDGWHKVALICERLKLPAMALDAYQRWQPKGTGCGTCNASIAARKAHGIVRCYRELNQFDKAIELCWAGLRRDDLMPHTQIAIELVELYEAQGRLDQLASEFDRFEGPPNSDAKVVSAYIEIVRAFQEERYEKVLLHLTGGRLSQPPETELRYWQDWRAPVIAERFGRIGERAVPILAEHLRSLSESELHHSLWVFEALRLTGSSKAIAPALEEAKRAQALSWPAVSRLFRSFPEVATARLAPLLADSKARWLAARELAKLGTSGAITAIIEHMPSGNRPLSSRSEISFAATCFSALWRLTGQTLDMQNWPDERIGAEGKSRWERWWREQAGVFDPKSLEWWQSADAEPALLRAFGTQRYDGTAVRDLMALEHPVLAQLLRRPQPDSEDWYEKRRWASVKVEVAKVWLRFDPDAAVPVLIELSNWSPKEVYPVLRPLARKDLGQRKEVWRAWWCDNKQKVISEVQERWW